MTEWYTKKLKSTKFLCENLGAIASWRFKKSSLHSEFNIIDSLYHPDGVRFLFGSILLSFHPYGITLNRV